MGPIRGLPNRQPDGESPAARAQGGTRYESLSFPWICTVLFIVAYVIVVIVYDQKNVFTPSEKHVFDFVTTGLSVFLGLSFYVSSKLPLKNPPNLLQGGFQRACTYFCALPYWMVQCPF